MGSNSFYNEDLQALLNLVQEGEIKPVIDEVLPLEGSVEGLRRIEDREVFGKIIIAP